MQRPPRAGMFGFRRSVLHPAGDESVDQFTEGVKCVESDRGQGRLLCIVGMMYRRGHRNARWPGTAPYRNVINRIARPVRLFPIVNRSGEIVGAEQLVQRVYLARRRRHARPALGRCDALRLREGGQDRNRQVDMATLDRTIEPVGELALAR